MADDTRTDSVDLTEAPVSPVKYGAVGDGVTNDTAAIQAAIDAAAASRGTALLPGQDRPPTTDEVREAFACDWQNGNHDSDQAAQFDRWLAAHDTEVKAGALRAASGGADKNLRTKFDAAIWAQDHCPRHGLFLIGELGRGYLRSWLSERTWWLRRCTCDSWTRTD